MRAIALTLVLLLIAGCSTTITIDRPQGRDVEIVVTDARTDAGSWGLRAHMAEWTEFPGLCQEIILSDGQVIVEYFLTPGGRFPDQRYDNHFSSGLLGMEVRSCWVYPAEVADVDWSGNFWCILPENRNGTVKTRINPWFNSKYQQEHEIRGRITKENQTLGVSWRVQWVGGNLTVTTPDGVRHTWR